MWPLIPHGQSDTASLDNALELLIAGGYPIAHAMMMLIPEAWARQQADGSAPARFLRIPCGAHRAVGRPGLHRLHRRPPDRRQRSTATACARRASSSPTTMSAFSRPRPACCPFPTRRSCANGGFSPARCLLIDLEEGRIIEDEEIKRTLSDARPYEDWLKKTQFKLEELDDLPEEQSAPANDPSALLDRQQAFGYTQEDIQFFLEPMAQTGDDPVGSMGTDVPLAVLSKKPKLLYNYFKQNFAQVTNPPIDPIREELVMYAGVDDRAAPESLWPPGRHAQAAGGFPARAHQRRSGKGAQRRDPARRRLPHRDHRHHLGRRRRRGRLERAVEKICSEATNAVLLDANILILSDRAVSLDRIAVPALLATAAVQSSSRQARPAHADRPRHRNRRSARGASFLRAGRLWRGGHQSLSRLRDAGAGSRAARDRAQAV